MQGENGGISDLLSSMSANAGTAERDLATKRVIDGLKQIYRQVSAISLHDGSFWGPSPNHVVIRDTFSLASSQTLPWRVNMH